MFSAETIPDRRAQTSEWQASNLLQKWHNKMLYPPPLDNTIYGFCKYKRATTEPYMKDETSISTRAKETKSKPWTGKMGKKKENIKLRDLESSKDAKGGRAIYAGPTYAGILREGGGPKPYYFGKTVTYMTRSGKVLDEDAVKSRIEVAVPIQVHYRGEGANRTIDRVILDED
jgi:hypothetical protein